MIETQTANLVQMMYGRRKPYDVAFLTRDQYAFSSGVGSCMVGLFPTTAGMAPCCSEGWFKPSDRVFAGRESQMAQGCRSFMDRNKRANCCVVSCLPQRSSKEPVFVYDLLAKQYSEQTAVLR